MRQSSGALGRACDFPDRRESGGGPPHSKTLRAFPITLFGEHDLVPAKNLNVWEPAVVLRDSRRHGFRGANREPALNLPES